MIAYHIIKSTIFYQHDLGLYFLDFLSPEQMRKYMFLSKSTFNIFQNSIYRKELSACKMEDNCLKISDICKGGHINLLKSYLKDGRFRNYDYYFFMCCLAMSNSLEMVKYMVPLVSDIGVENNYAIQLACESGNLEVVKYLVSMGADIRNSDDVMINVAVSN